MQLLTNSRMACAKTCLRKHYFQYELGLRKDRESTPLRVGSAVHLGLDLMAQGQEWDAVADKVCEGYQEIPPWAEADEWLTERETVLRLLHGYKWRWQDEPLEVVATEQEFRLPLINPATGYASKLWELGGKIDKIVKLPDGRLAVMEHKTTSDSLDSSSDYWPRLRLDSQISLYVLAARTLGHNVSTVLYDVIRKPSIAPRKLTKAEQKQLQSTRLWFGEQVELVDSIPERESPAMYGSRLTSDLAERRDFYFARREIPRLEADLEEFANEIWQQQQMLRECQRSGFWFRNSAACAFCEFKEICFQGLSVTRDAVPPGYRLGSIHPELSLTP